MPALLSVLDRSRVRLDARAVADLGTYEMQIYVNGREWLARQMDQAGIGYRRSDNKITAVDDFGAITALGERFAHTAWPWSGRQPWSIRCCPTSNAPASPATGIDQCEYASDVLFTDRAALETIQGDLVAVTALGATDVLHFLGRKPHPAFAGEVTIDSKKRLPGALPPQSQRG